MNGTTTFQAILNSYRLNAFSGRDMGDKFERLMQAYLLTDPRYAYKFKNVWLWSQFPGRTDLGGFDTGIDLVALTQEGDYWAIQCKCFQESTIIDKPAVDSFLSTSSRQFVGHDLKTARFAHRLWISTSNKWGPNASEAIKNQNPPVTRLNLFDLQEAPVDWGKLEKGIHGEPSRLTKKTLRPHQKEALEKAHEYFKTADRGKLIMACGTGKTFNTLRIAEHETDGTGFILFLVPSIALLGQILKEWSAEANEPINAVCICSDPEVSRKRSRLEDTDLFSVVDLALPASTNVTEILSQVKRIRKTDHRGMTVVFSTYQSIEVISRAQKEMLYTNDGFGEFDLIICDEAHRTTGVTLSGEDESAFTKVHDNDFIMAKKRLYMTATPRLYSDDIKSKAAQADAELCSMDDVALYGEEIYRIGFGEAVERDLLTDYKVLILTLSENDVPPAVQKMIADKESEINTDDASKLIGCINALSKKVLGDEGIIKSTDPGPMHRAVAFCQSIAVSKKITATFNSATEAYLGSLPREKKEEMVTVSSRHMDGTMTVPVRDELLGWLKSEAEENECRILTNVRCLSEGVDVPSLDSVMFLSARNSQVDVVQSVGRVMRKAPNKKYGYIIIPVVVPANVEADKALDDNERFKVVWTVLNALRAHDDRFNATVNKIELNRSIPENILVGRPEYSFGTDGSPIMVDPDVSYGTSKDFSNQLALQFEQLQNVVYARMVLKVGDRRYWEQWAKSVAEISQKHVERITKLVRENEKYKTAFNKFIQGLQKNINPNIQEKDAIEMLSQHIITAPVFDALFEGYSFVKNNPISLSMQKVLHLLDEQSLEKDTESLSKFYESVRKRAEGIDNSDGRQKIVLELYEKYFKTAMPKMVEKLGIVYTPVEVVDFIIHSVNDVLKKEFGRSLSDENIHILDPFTGTGTFITRLLQSGLIDKKDLYRKYKNEIHANEIVLLAYYIAAVNIENAYHEAVEENDYTPFDGICLTDTFQLGESENEGKLFSEMFPQNSERVAKQIRVPLRVIMGNPPYSIGQKSADDNASNQEYPKLDKRILNTYSAGTSSKNSKALYDAYIKAFRWSTDRLDKNGGIVCFVSNGSWLDGNTQDGFRKSLEREFSSIYVFNTRGNARTSGELRRKEAGNVFGGGSRTPIAITLLVKNPNQEGQRAFIHYMDIGDYLSREGKLLLLKDYGTCLNDKMTWQTITPNEHGDWISQRNDAFGLYFPIGDPKASSYFSTYCYGLTTARDAWVYHFSKRELSKLVARTICFFNKHIDSNRIINKANVNSKIEINPNQISWSRGLKGLLVRGHKIQYNESSVRDAIYRPYTKQRVYFDKYLNEYLYKFPNYFPSIDSENLIITVAGVGASKTFSCIISNKIIDLQTLSNAQCFPLFFYEERPHVNRSLFDEDIESDYRKRDGISDFILEKARKQYGKHVTKEDIFYYVYGFLHSSEYKEKYSNDLKKMLPRIPLVDDVRDFWAFSKAGRKLADLHINYENVPPYTSVKVTGADSGHFTVEKMHFPKKGQKDTIIYNSRITISNIPSKAYEYIVNGKSAIEWIMERYQITVHKESGIKNDPNDWALEVGNPRYILDLLLSIINVSVQTVEIVNGMPKLKFE